MKLKYKKAFMMLLISHSIILCLSLCISAFTYINVEKLVKDEIKQYYSVVLDRNKDAVDSALKSLSGILYEISLNEKVTEISRYAVPLTSEQFFNASSSGKYFSFSEFDYMIEDVYIVFPQIDLVVGSFTCNNMKNYYNIYLKNKFESFETWNQMSKANYNMDFIVSDNSQDIFYVNSISQVRNGIPTAIIFLDLNENVLFTHSSNENGLHFLIYDNKEDGIAPVLGFEDDKFDIAKAISASTYNYEGEQYFVLTKDSDQNTWKYIYLISMTNFVDRMMSIRLWLVLGIVITSIAGILLLLILTKRQYKPIEKTVSMLSKNFGRDTLNRGEYEYIESVIKRISEDFQAESVVAREVGIKELAFLKLLRGETYNEALRRIIENNLTKKYYMVAIFHIEDAGKLFFEEKENEDNINLAYFIIGNVFSDILGSKFEVEKCRSDNLILVIGSDDNDVKDEVYKWLCEGQNIIEKEFNILFSVMLSKLMLGKENLPERYSEALECFTHRFFTDNSIIKYEDISNTDFGAGYYYPLEQERSMINYLKLADYDKAKNLLEKMLDFNLRNKEMSPMTFRCMIYDVCGTVVKTISEIGEDGEDFLENLSIFKKIEECDTIKKIQGFLTNLLLECCLFIENRNEESSNKTIDHIKSYVVQNYEDTNLSVAWVAEKFDMNANYLSTLFKQKAGVSLWEYITAVRMEKAQEIFKDERLKVEKVALRCGYENVRTFSRVFTKHTGMSPGKFRDKI